MLICESHVASLDLLREIVEDSGYQVLVAKTGSECVDIAHQTAPHVVSVSQCLPGMAGLEALRTLRNDPRTAGIRLLLMSDMDTEDLRRDARTAGADAVLAKPFSPDALLETLAMLTAPLSP